MEYDLYQKDTFLNDAVTYINWLMFGYMWINAIKIKLTKLCTELKLNIRYYEKWNQIKELQKWTNTNIFTLNLKCCLFTLKYTFFSIRFISKFENFIFSFQIIQSIFFSCQFDILNMIGLSSTYNRCIHK